MCNWLRHKKPKPKPPGPPPAPPKPKPPVPPAPPKPPPTPGPPVPVPPKPPAGQRIQIVARTSLVSAAEVTAAVAALQVQVDRDYLPAYGGKGVNLEAVQVGEATDLSTWQVLLLDNSDQAGALGYHDVTPAGQPLGKVFVATDLQYGESWTVTTSHELLEMLADPNVDQTVDDAQGWTYPRENCDAVEGDTSTELGVLVSNFVLPSWFDARGKAPFDHLGKLRAPFTLDKGGYVSIDKHDGKGWIQQYGQHGPAAYGYSSRAKVGSRRERRGIPKSDWLRSAS